ncbi:helix-turn-helix domain-containing protein [Flavivirga rizhaonensis]|uniref:Helix-turn-helix domain-containing protein n=1 Tax=Flavivirga rizhaonensis TaxID=2559571 RepID=A0A4V3P515_9FLAO|nr:helix-turn-helix domain-containing protein [Flavivirga rizhaonensis]TGV03604.1 helix-turn-helix domain-containing protein [Flavivirga rizhaonensis]
MHTDYDKKKLTHIYNALMEFASGNLTIRLKTTHRKDEIETLARLINVTLDKVSTFFYHDGFVNQTETYNYRIQSIFILDWDDSMVAFNPSVKKILAFNENELKAKPFNSLLTDKSKLEWDYLKSELSKKGKLHNEFIELSFKTKQDSIIIMNCLVDKLLGENGSDEKIFITSVEIEKDSEKKKGELYKKITTSTINNAAPKRKNYKYQITLKPGDLEKINQVHEYIQENLSDPLPSLKKLAESIGTNESRLRHGFKFIYGESPYGFFKSERLNKALQLVKNSDVPIKKIATLTGFKHVSHFTIAFKNKYNYTPRDIRKQSHINKVEKGFKNV